MGTKAKRTGKSATERRAADLAERVRHQEQHIEELGAAIEQARDALGRFAASRDEADLTSAMEILRAAWVR